MNDENLIPFNQLSPREHAEISRKGAIASNAKQKQKKLIREIVAEMLAQTVDSMGELGEYKEIKPLMCMLGEEKTLASLMVAGQIRSAIDGNSKAFDLLTNLNDSQVDTGDDKKYDDLSITELRGLLNANKQSNTPKT